MDRAEGSPCGSCPSHEGQAAKVNIMWGSGKTLSVVGVLIVGGLFALIMDTRLDAKAHVIEKDMKIESVEKASITRDAEIMSTLLSSTRELTGRDNRIEMVYTELSVNLKRFMESQGITYIESTHVSD